MMLRKEKNMNETVLSGEAYAKMIRDGATYLAAHAKAVNDLNVFPIPDGDTGDNMLMTMQGGAGTDVGAEDTLGEAAHRIAQSMLLGARGNSGVILSQFFEGISEGFDGLRQADADQVKTAFRAGVSRAYRAVSEPTEGTILTVMREATDFACRCQVRDAEEFLERFIEEAEKSLERTPELLAVLKHAGVVDSGGAGFLYLVRGMLKSCRGEEVGGTQGTAPAGKPAPTLNCDLFDENTEMKYGYCTEVLLRLQTRKTDPESFDVKILTDYLHGIGNSIVAVKSGTAVKIHVHTMEPEKVFAFCHQFGEFLTVKVENMMLQHSATELPDTAVDEPEAGTSGQQGARQTYAVVAVACGEGLRQAFRESGAAEVIEGGQSMNPSAQDFLDAFERADAETIFVLPNNGNVVLTARQAADLYTGSKVYVLDLKTIGQGYAALSMMNTELGGTAEILDGMRAAMENVRTVEVSRAVRDADMDGFCVRAGDYIGIEGKKIVSCDAHAVSAVCRAALESGLDGASVCILFEGAGGRAQESSEIRHFLKTCNQQAEVYTMRGDQPIYDYILILE